MLDLWPYLLLAAAGVAAGVVNTMAGGGSLLTLPALMLLGMPADVANGTNRLAVVAQSMSGLIGFHRHGELPANAVLPIVLPTVIGASAGAAVATRVPTHVLEYVLLGTMAAVAVLMAVAPRMVTTQPDSRPAPAPRRLAGSAGLLAAGFYGGFIQAGVGFLLLAVLSGLMRMELVRANALKMACTGVFSVAALGVFVAAGDVAWLPGAVLALATITGAQLGVRFTVKVRPDLLRWIIVACVVATCVAALARSR